MTLPRSESSNLLLHLGSPRLWLGVGLGAFALHMILAIATCRGLIWEGTVELFDILNARDFVWYDEVLHHRRDFVVALHQIPTLLLLWSGVNNIPVLMYVFSATLLIHPIIAGWLGWHVLRKTNKLPYGLFALLAFASFGIGMSLYAIWEPQVFISLSWPLLFYILFDRSLRGWDIALILGLCLLAFRGGEVLIFSLPVIGAALIVRLRQGGDSRALTLLWIALLGYIAITTLYYAHHLQHIPDNYKRYAQLSMFDVLPWALLIPQVWVASFSAFFAALIMLVFAHPRKRRSIGDVTCVLLVVLFCLGIISLLSTTIQIVEVTGTRLVYVFINATAQLVVVFFAWRESAGASKKVPIQYEFPVRHLCLLVGLALTLQSAAHIKTTWYWSRYVALLKNEVDTKSGYIPYDQSVLNAPTELSRFLWNFNHNFVSDKLSILLNGTEQIHTIIGLRCTQRLKPFDPQQPSTLQILRFPFPESKDSVYTTAVESKTFDYASFFSNETAKHR